ncbi:MAG TPA: DUF899 domain-containing protein [Streptosporangiaceae bacterium]|nr:DUF899 domain-containing protein [Streptosporangiaceae bacterium]
MNLPPVVSYEQWLAARVKLLAREKELTRLHDALDAGRRQLPMVRVDKDYVLAGPHGHAGLLDLFEGCRQLIVQHFMFDPEWEAGCPSCAAFTDELPPGILARLRARDTAFALVSLAPLAQIMVYQAWKGWPFPWYSSYGSDFNFDFHVTLDQAVAPVLYNYQSKEEILAETAAGDLVETGQRVEVPGISCFIHDGGSVFHTYSVYDRGLERIAGVDGLLELTVLGSGQGRSVTEAQPASQSPA